MPLNPLVVLLVWVGLEAAWMATPTRAGAGRAVSDRAGQIAEPYLAAVVMTKAKVWSVGPSCRAHHRPAMWVAMTRT